MGTLSFRIREFTLPTYPISIVNAQLTWPLSDTITWRHKRLFFHITRLSHHHIAMWCHHKVILHQAQGYFRKLWSWVQQAFHAGIRPTLPNEGCRAAGQVAVMLSLFSAPLPTCSSQPPEPVRFTWWLPMPLFSLLSDATTFIFLHVSAKYFGPPSHVFPVFLPIIVTC